jgi:Protein of unknown function (DUF669)
MAIIDLSGIPDAEETEVIPEGQYHVVCTDVQHKESRVGNPYWQMKLRVLGGEYDGATITDLITFSPDGLKRVKLVLDRLGNVDVSRPFELNDVNLVGCQAIVDVGVEVQKNEANGQTYTRNKVKFGGYQRLAQQAAEVAPAPQVAIAPPPQQTIPVAAAARRPVAARAGAVAGRADGLPF